MLLHYCILTLLLNIDILDYYILHYLLLYLILDIDYKIKQITCSSGRWDGAPTRVCYYFYMIF